MPISPQSILRTLQPQVGIELGSSMTRVAVTGKGLLIEEPTALVTHQHERKTLLVGQDAQEMEGKIAAPLQLHYPIQEGSVCDDRLTIKLLRHFFQKSLGKSYVLKPEVMASIPSDNSMVQRQALKEVLFASGARQVYLIDEVLAAAIGAGVPVADSGGNIIFHMGGGHTEVAVISLGTIVKSRFLPLGGRHLDHQLRRFLRKYYQFDISWSQAEQLKSQITLLPLKEKKSIIVKGRMLSTGLPSDIEVELAHLEKVIEQALQPLIAMMQHFLEDIPAALAADVIDKGFILTGGVGKMKGIEKYFAQIFTIPVTVAEDPDRAVIKGIELALEHLPLYKQSLAFE